MILVAGPPCGGKTTYVQKHALPEESVLDFDDLVEEIAGDRYRREPSVLSAAFAEWKHRLPSSDWVVWTAPRRRERGSLRERYGAQVYVLMVEMDECLRRARESRPPMWEGLVRAWFAAWEPSRSGREWIVREGAS